MKKSIFSNIILKLINNHQGDEISDESVAEIIDSITKTLSKSNTTVCNTVAIKTPMHKIEAVATPLGEIRLKSDGEPVKKFFIPEEFNAIKKYDSAARYEILHKYMVGFLSDPKRRNLPKKEWKWDFKENCELNRALFSIYGDKANEIIEKFIEANL